MAHRVAGGVEGLKLDRLADLHHVASFQPYIQARDLVLGAVMGQHLRPGGADHGFVAANVVAVLVRVEDLSDLPTARLGAVQTLAMIERVDGEVA